MTTNLRGEADLSFSMTLPTSNHKYSLTLHLTTKYIQAIIDHPICKQDFAFIEFGAIDSTKFELRYKETSETRFFIAVPEFVSRYLFLNFAKFE